MSDNDRVVPLRPPVTPPVMGPGPVLIVADDRAAAAAQRLLKEYAIVAAPALTDMTALAGRAVTILPKAGERADAERLYSAIVAAKVWEARIIDAATLRKGFDLDNTTGDELRRLVRDAPGFADPQEIARLAQMDDAAYASECKASSKRIDVPLKRLDGLRREWQRQLEAAAEVAEAAGTTLPIVPALLPVVAATLLTDLVSTIGRFVALRPEEIVAVALWVVGAHAIPAFDLFPRLLLTAPSEAAGKTTLVRLLAHLVPRPFRWDDPSPPSVYRALDQGEPPTFLLDEMDALPSNDRLRRVINSGYQRGAFVVVTENRRPKRYPTFAAMAVSMIGMPRGTTVSRSIVMRMRRRRFDEPVEIFDERDPAVIAELARLASQAARFAADNIPALRAARPTLPLMDRSRDNWTSLASIADLAGDEWPERSRGAAIVLESFRDRDSKCDALGADLTEMLAEKPKQSRFSSDDTAAWLLESGDGRWHEEGLTKHRLSRLLREAGCEVKTAKIAGKPVRTYSRETLLDFVARYGPRPNP
jgi:hypothetical protein